MDQHDILEWTSKKSSSVHSCIEYSCLLYERIKLLEKEKIKRDGEKPIVMLVTPKWIKKLWDTDCIE